jgi:acetyltransferase-like isoleucine patch superfamily enzyme
VAGDERTDRLAGALTAPKWPAADSAQGAASAAPAAPARPRRRPLRRAAQRVRELLWTLQIAWLRACGMGTVCRALRVAPPALVLRILRAFGAELGEGAVVRPPLHLLNTGHDLSQLRIGERAWIGPDVLLDLSAPLRIGDRATLSARTSIVTHLDVGASRLRSVYPHVEGPVTIGDDVYLGTAVVVLHGVEIGAGALVAAGAVVRSSVPPGAVAAGVPARLVKRVPSEEGGA